LHRGCQQQGARADGNKLFQSEFISVIRPGATLVQQLEFNLLNSSVALWGYYAAAFTIDLPWMGRRRMQARAPARPGGKCWRKTVNCPAYRMNRARRGRSDGGATETPCSALWVQLIRFGSWCAQVMGFGWLLVLFLACGLAFGPLTASAAGLRGFQTLYFISSFWAQFGPNATTFLVVRARRLLFGPCGGLHSCIVTPDSPACLLLAHFKYTLFKYTLQSEAGELHCCVCGMGELV